MRRTLGWVALLTTAGIGLWFAPTPVSNVSSEGIGLWFASARPDQVAVVLVRFVAALWWLRAVTSTAYLLIATLADAPGHIDNAVAKLPSIGRRLVRPIAVTVVATTLATTAPAIAQVAPDTTEPATSIPFEPEPTPTSSAVPGLVMTRLPDTGWPDYSYPTTASDLDPGVATTETASSSTAVGETWIVERGDHLWSIAQRTAPEGATDGEVSRHWLAMIELNRANLADPNNPDLIYPGDVIDIP